MVTTGAKFPNLVESLMNVFSDLGFIPGSISFPWVQALVVTLPGALEYLFTIIGYLGTLFALLFKNRQA